MQCNQSAPGPRGGISLLEMLVVLAIISFSAAIVLSHLRGPSPELQLRQRLSEVSARIAQLRLVAIRSGQVQVLDTADMACEASGDEILMFDDGMVSGGDLCLSSGPVTLRLHPAALTGQLGLANVP